MLAHSASPFSHWSLEPLQLVPIAIAAFLYARRVRTLGRRGTPVPPWRIALFGLGAALVAVSLATPIGALGETELFSAHMLQHVMLGDLAPLAMLAGLTGPVLRPVLALRPVERLRVLAHPVVALPLWAANLAIWHLPPLYEGALRHDALHVLEHALFFGCAALMWAAVLETLPGPQWFGTGAKMGYVLAVRMVGTVLANVFLWAGTPIYDFYARAENPWGISPLNDQELAGGIMMIEGSLVTIGALAWLFLRMAKEGELRQELLERGLDPRAVRRAVRYGRAEDLSRSR